MANPTVTAKAAYVPGGKQIPDGFQSVFVFASAPTIGLWEKTVKPPGIDGGEPTDNTTMVNSVWETFRAQKLKKIDSIVLECAYDPNVIQDIINLTNVEGAGTAYFPDGTNVSVWCYLQKAEFAALKKGELPMATVTIVVTNWDPVNGVEAGPAITVVVGT